MTHQHWTRREFGALIAGVAGATFPGMPSVRTARSPVAAASRRGLAGPLVNGARLNAHLDALHPFGRTPAGGISRLAYSDADRDARRVVL